MLEAPIHTTVLFLTFSVMFNKLPVMFNTFILNRLVLMICPTLLMNTSEDRRLTRLSEP